MSTEREFSVAVRDAIADRLGACEITEIERRGDGFSWDTFLVVAQVGDDQRGFAVKREPRGGINPTAYDADREARLLRALRGDLGLPVPEVVASVPATAETPGFYVMEKVPGFVPMAWDVGTVLPDDGDRERIGLELADAIGRLHSADPAAIDAPGFGTAVDGARVGYDEATRWSDIYREYVPVRVPIIDLAFAWLKARADWVSGRVALTHRDLRIGNVIVDDGRVAAILDWETAEVTDPTSDIARFNLPTFRGRSERASQLVTMPRFLDAYEARTGWRPSERSLRYWTVLELMNIIVGSIRAGQIFATGGTSDVRYAAMAYQTHHHIRSLIRLHEAGEWGTAA